MRNELYHYGTPRHSGRYPWGSGKDPYQNRDGTLTPEGRRRRRQAEPTVEEKQQAIKEAGINKAYKKVMFENSKTKAVKDIVDDSSKIVNQAKQMSDSYLKNSIKKEKLDLSKMSDKEMREKINRELLERQYNSLFAEEKSTASKGAEALNKTLTIASSVLAAGSTALGIALSIKQLKGGGK